MKKTHGFTNEKMIILPRDLLSNVTTHPLLSSLYITDIGYFPDAKNHYRDRSEGSEQYILIINMKGTGYIYINGERLMIKENTLLLIPKGVAHTYGTESINPWNIYWVHFNGENAPFYLKEECNGSFYVKSIHISLVQKITSLFNLIFNCLETGLTLTNVIHSSQILGYLLSSLFIHVDYTNERIDKYQAMLLSLFDYMRENINRQLSLNDLTEQVRLSKSQLTLIFKTKTGYSPIDYFIKMKIQEASKLLNLTDLSVSDIGRNIGYEDPYYFSRIFKQVMGVSPTEYRKKQLI